MEYRIYSRPGWNVELFHEPNLIPVGSTQGRHNLAYWLKRRTVELSNSRTVELSNSRTVEQLNSRTVEQSNSRTVERSNSRTVEQSNSPTVELSNSRTVELSNSRTIERSANSLTVELSNSRTVEQQWNSRTKYIQKSYAEMGCGNIKYNIKICAFDSAREDIDVYESESFQSRNFRLLQARSSTEPLQLQ